MTRRFIRTLVHILVAAQVLLGAPAVNAYAPAASAAAQSNDEHCAGMMAQDAPRTGNEPACPCCPEGGTQEASCFSSCLATPGASPGLASSAVRRISAAPASVTSVQPASLSEPPLKPPPIV